MLSSLLPDFCDIFLALLAFSLSPLASLLAPTAHLFILVVADSLTVVVYLHMAIVLSPLWWQLLFTFTHWFSQSNRCSCSCSCCLLFCLRQVYLYFHWSFLDHDICFSFSASQTLSTNNKFGHAKRQMRPAPSSPLFPAPFDPSPGPLRPFPGPRHFLIFFSFVGFMFAILGLLQSYRTTRVAPHPCPQRGLNPWLEILESPGRSSHHWIMNIKILAVTK